MAKGDNLTQIKSALEPTDIAWLNEQNPGMGQRFNATLVHLGNVLGAAAGHRGTPQLLRQKSKNVKGLVDASLDVMKGRIENVQDPVLDLDAVNLQTLRRHIFTEEQSRKEVEEALLPLLPPTPPPSFTGTGSYFFPLGENYFWSLTNAGGGSYVANTVYVTRFQIFDTFTFTGLVAKLSAAVAGKNFGVSIYSNDGNTQLINAVFSTALPIGIKTSTFPAVRLVPGSYWIAGNTDNAGGGAQFLGVLPVSLKSSVLNALQTHQGTAANPAVAGQNPSTLGTITATGDIAEPLVMLQG